MLLTGMLLSIKSKHDLALSKFCAIIRKDYNSLHLHLALHDRSTKIALLNKELNWVGDISQLNYMDDLTLAFNYFM